jgi:hypothetical protein
MRYQKNPARRQHQSTRRRVWPRLFGTQTGTDPSPHLAALPGPIFWPASKTSPNPRECCCSGKRDRQCDCQNWQLAPAASGLFRFRINSSKVHHDGIENPGQRLIPAFDKRRRRPCLQWNAARVVSLQNYPSWNSIGSVKK